MAISTQFYKKYLPQARNNISRPDRILPEVDLPLNSASQVEAVKAASEEGGASAEAASKGHVGVAPQEDIGGQVEAAILNLRENKSTNKGKLFEKLRFIENLPASLPWLK